MASVFGMHPGEARAIGSPGTGLLHVRRDGSRSRVTRAYAASPLRILTPQNHGVGAWIYTSTYGGGLVGGDALRLGVDIGPDAVAFLGSQAATKVYRSPAGTTVDIAATVHPGGLLVVAPDPVVCFAGSTYRQTLRFDLAGTAELVLVDAFTSGRHGSGERWQFDRYQTRAEIWRDGRLVTLDTLALAPDDGAVARRMGRFEACAVITLVGPAVDAEAAALVAQIAERPVGRRADLLVAASAIAGGGCVVRVAGISVEAVGRTVRESLRFVPSLLGDDPWARKW